MKLAKLLSAIPSYFPSRSVLSFGLSFVRQYHAYYEVMKQPAIPSAFLRNRHLSVASPVTHYTRLRDDGWS